MAVPVSAQEAPPDGYVKPAEPIEEVPPEEPIDSQRSKEVPLDRGSPESSWVAPPPSKDDVSLGEVGVAVRAGSSPVEVSATESGEQGRGVRVEVFDQEVAERLGAAGFVFEVTAEPSEKTGPDQLPLEVPVSISVDYADLVGRFGAGFAARLQVVAVPECVLVDPLPKDCEQVEQVLEGTNDRATDRIAVELAPDVGEFTPEIPTVPEEPPAPAAPDVNEEPSTTTTTDLDATTSTTTTTTAGFEGQAGGTAGPAQEGGDDQSGTSSTSSTSTTVADTSTTSEPGAEEPEEAVPEGDEGGMVLLLTSGSDGEDGSFSATPLSQSGTWQVGAGSGEFSWSYPVPLQPGPAGDGPSFELGYSSGRVDGMTGGENNQSSMVGLGWDHTTAFIERSYKPCNQDGAAPEIQDLCWYSHNAVLHLNGVTTRLVPVNSAATEWRAQEDPNWKVERLTGAPAATNEDANGEYWRVTIPDGTKYLFGRGATYEGSEETRSAWTVPVFHNSPGEGDCTDPYGLCTEAWRWNLDRVVDLNDNVTSLFYLPEANNYGGANGSTPWGYISGGRLLEIKYGIRNLSTTQAHTRLVLEAAYRCNTLSEACGAPTHTNGTQFPDVPNDQICASNCSEHNPSFFFTKRIFRLSSQTRDASGWREVDAVRLGHEWVSNGEGQEALWVRFLQRSGYSEFFGATIPTMKFEAANDSNNNLLPNRVIGDLKQYRLGRIYTDTGSRIDITYGRPNPCSWGSLPSAWDTNGADCFPKYWTPVGGSPAWGTFNKYLVTKVETFDDLIFPAPRVAATSYEYEGSAAWHYDDNPIYPAGATNFRSWSEWRGYGVVLVESGSGGTTQTRTQHRVFRGMHGDRLANGTYKTVNLYTYGGVMGPYPDYNFYRARPLEERRLDGALAGITASVHEYTFVVTAGWSAVWAGESRRIDRRAVPPSGTEYYVTDTTYNTNRLTSRVSEDGWDTGSGHGADERCTETSYASDVAAWKLDFPSSRAVRENSCANTADVQNQRWNYDGGANGTAPTDGNVTTEGHATAPFVWLDSAYGYDTLGRVTSAADPAGNITTTTYSNGTGYPGTTTTKRWLDTNLSGSNFHQDVSTWHPERRTNPVQTSDPNGRVTTYGYDGAGRLTSVRLPTEEGTPTQPSWRFTYRLAPHLRDVNNLADDYGVAGPIRVTTEQLQAKAPEVYLKSYVLYDGLLRERQTQTASPSSGKTIVADTTYDSRGLVSRASMPEAITATPGDGIIGFPSGIQANYHIYAYDNLERATRDEFFVGPASEWTTLTSYSGGTVEVDPPVGGNTRTVTDKFGRPSQVQQFDSGTSLWDTATYANDAVGLLQAITDPAGNQIQYDYDRMGRRTAMRDPDAGTWAYGYDPAGNQTLVQDNLPATADLYTTYDRLNRPTSLREGSTTGPARGEWLYDSTGQKGLLDTTIRHQTSGVYTGDYINDITAYDARDRVTARTQTVPSSLGTGLAGTYAYAYAYNDTDAPTAVTYGFGAGTLGVELVGTTYSALGAPTALATLDATFSTHELVSGTTFDDRHRVQTRTLGAATDPNRVTREYGYDNQQRLNRWKATKPTGTIIQDDQVTMDDVGNVISRIDARAQASPVLPQTECFGYDQRNRLTVAYTTTVAQPAGQTCVGPANGEGPSPYLQLFAYAPDGKITSRWGTGGAPTYTYPAQGAGSTQPHAVQALSGTTNDCDTGATGTQNYCYDTNGNLTARPATNGTGTQTLTWDNEHRLTRVDDNGTPTGAETDFVHDIDGSRLVRKTPTNTTLYLEGHELTLTGTTLTTKRYYQLSGITVAVRDSAGSGSLNYLLGDQLGSTSVTVNGSTGTVATQRYLPYGGIRTSSGTQATERGWIGQTKDSSTGLQYLNARYYDPAIGRFTAVDPLADMSQPGSLDGYGYGLGSPVTLSDPSGLRVPVGNGSDPDSGGSIINGKLVVGNGGGGGGGRGPIRTSTQRATLEVGRTRGLKWVPKTADDWALYGQQVVDSMHPCAGAGSVAGYYECQGRVGGYAAEGLLMEASGISDMKRCLEARNTGSCGWFALDVAASAVGGGGHLDDGIGALHAGSRGIRVTSRSLGHINDRHFWNGSMTAGRSVFLDGEDVVALVSAAESTTAVPQGRNFVRILDAGHDVGVDRATGLPTSVYSVVTKGDGTLVTTFPGTPVKGL